MLAKVPRVQAPLRREPASDRQGQRVLFEVAQGTLLWMVSRSVTAGSAPGGRDLSHRCDRRNPSSPTEHDLLGAYAGGSLLFGCIDGDGNSHCSPLVRRDKIRRTRVW